MDHDRDERNATSSSEPLPDEELWAAERMVEALIFAAERPVSVKEIQERLPRPVDVEATLERLTTFYEGRGIALVQVAGGWQFRTASDLAFLLRREDHERRRLSRAALETLAIIAYHQPVTRAEIEEIRGVSLSKGTLDLLLEAGWVRPAGRRRTPGLPLEFRTTDEFLSHFGLNSLEDLPGLAELKAAGLLDSLEEALARMEEEAAQEGANRPEAEEEIADGAPEAGE